MYVKAHPPTRTPAVQNNSGSCQLLVEYLEKENKGKEPQEKTSFFSHQYDRVSTGTVIKRIDENKKNLSKSDIKFYMLSINPSHRELQHLIEKATGQKRVENFNTLSPSDRDKVNEQLREYTRGVMDLYAKEFNRENVKGGEDLVYYAKIETSRQWKHYEKDVKDGLQVSGSEKKGLNLHIHVIVSRNNVDQNTKLSPLSKSKGGKQKLNGKDVMQGFNHEHWKQYSSQYFNEKFGYKPYDKEMYKPKSNNISVLGNHAANSINTGKKIAGKVVPKEIASPASGHFKDEKAAIQNAKRVIALVTNPSAAVVQEIKNKFFSILISEASKSK